MDYKRTMQIEFQSSSYHMVSDLEHLIGRAVSMVLEHAAMMDGYDHADYKGDRSTVNGWASDIPESDPTDVADEETLLAEAERRREFSLRGGVSG